jgi:hypothetical protein
MFTNDIYEAAVTHIKRVLVTLKGGEAVIRKLDGK